MRNIFFALSFFFSIAMFGQSPNTPPIEFASRFQITNVANGTSDTLIISGYVDDCTGRFANSNISIGDSLYVLEGADLLIFGVVTNKTISLGVATFKAIDFNGAGLNPSNGQAAIFHPTTTNKLPSYVCGLRDELQQFISNRQAQMLDEIINGGGTTTGAIVGHQNTSGDTLTGGFQKIIFDVNNGNYITRNNGTSTQIGMENGFNVMLSNAVTSTGSLFPVNLASGTVFSHTLTGSTATIANPTNMASGRFGIPYRIILKNASGASSTVTFSSSWNKKNKSDVGNVVVAADDSLIYNFQLERNAGTWVMTSMDDLGGSTTLASNGLTMDGDTVQLGGTPLNENTTINIANKNYNVSGDNVIINIEPDATQPIKLDYIYQGNNYSTTSLAPSSTGTELQVEAGTSTSKYGKLSMSGNNNQTPEVELFTRNASTNKGIFIDSTGTYITVSGSTKYPLATTTPSTTAGDTSIQVVTGNPGTAVWIDIDDIGGGGGGGTIINPTDNTIPKRLNSGAFANSLITDDGTTVSVTGAGKSLAADNGSSLKAENLFLERANNSTGTVISNMTTNATFTIPAGVNDQIRVITNNTGRAFTIDPNSTETIGGAATMSLIDGERLIIVYNSATTDWMILGGKLGDVSRLNDKYWNSTASAYQDTAWVASYSTAKQQLIRKGLLDEFEIPQLPYSVPVPDTVFSNLLNKYNWEINIIEDAQGARVQTNINSDIFKARESYEVPYYVDVLAGNDANSGLTEALAWKTLDKAMSTAAAKHVWVKPGVYTGVNSFNSKNATGDKVFRRMGGKQGDVVVAGGINTNTWTLKAGTMYNTAYSSTIGVMDKNAPKNADSTFVLLTNVADTATCRATPGSWIMFNSFVYVNLYDGAAPGTGRVTLLVSSADNGAVLIPSSVTATVYVEGFDFYGLGRSVVTNYNSSLIFKNCRKIKGRFTTSTGMSGFLVGTTVAGAGFVFMDGCEAYDNSDDGFSYGNVSGSTFRIIELNCTGYTNFQSAATAIDGSSIHQKCSVLRIGGGKTFSGKPGGYYYDNGNNGIHDTGLTGPARVWNVGITCYSQRNLNISGVDMFMGGSSTTGLKTYHTLCNVPLTSTSSVTWKNEGGSTTELRWCYPNTTGAPSLGTTSGTLTIKK